MPSIGSLTIEPMVPEEVEFLKESCAERRERLKSGAGHRRNQLTGKLYTSF